MKPRHNILYILFSDNRLFECSLAFVYFTFIFQSAGFNCQILGALITKSDVSHGQVELEQQIVKLN
jgi:hypothetical protein